MKRGFIKDKIYHHFNELNDNTNYDIYSVKDIYFCDDGDIDIDICIFNATATYHYQLVEGKLKPISATGKAYLFNIENLVIDLCE